MAEIEATWDGLPVARERPYACVVVVWRHVDRRREFLLLHRLAPGGVSFEGEWAWTPPSGARQPGETPDAAARRELQEEVGLELPLTYLRDASASEDVAVYVAEAPADVEVVLDEEHDRFVWLTLEEALPKCLPPVVAEGLSNAATWIEAHTPQAHRRTQDR
jgi:8-oxo-dGTP pyrophosphatase MutT (NUDIX family)